MRKPILNPLRSLRALQLIKNKTAESAKNAEKIEVKT